MKMSIRDGLFIGSDDNIACCISSFNLYKNTIFIDDIKNVSFEGSRCMIYTKDYNLVHSLIKYLLSANFIGEFAVKLVENNLKEDVLKPVLNTMLTTNNHIMQSYGSLYTPKGYMTVNAIDTSKIDLYMLDTKSNEKTMLETQHYNVRGRKLYRYTYPNTRQVA